MINRLFRRIVTTIFKLFFPQFRGAEMYGIPKGYYLNRVKLGKKVHINDGVYINGIGNVSIGDYSVLSHGVTICTAKNNINRWVRREEDEDVHEYEPVAIGKNVWLCTNTTICSGVTIADNCVVAAGAVVTTDLNEECCIYGGIPARMIKRLETEDIIGDILK